MSARVWQMIKCAVHSHARLRVDHSEKVVTLGLSFSPSGSFGAAVTLCATGKEAEELTEIEKQCSTKIKPLPGDKN